MHHRVQYLCNICNTAQNILFTPEMKGKYIPKDLNGLALYSDTHLCKGGILGINNLYIDHNLDVRSYNYIDLPKYKKKVKMTVPGAPKVTDGTRCISITHVMENNDLNIVIQDDMSEYIVKVGIIEFNKQSPLKTLYSDNQFVSLKFYYSNTRYTSQIEKWMEIFLNNLEMLIPSKLGLIMEVLRFILVDKNNFPTEFDTGIIQTIFASHDIFFELTSNTDTSLLSTLYGDDYCKFMEQILKNIKDKPQMQLHSYVTEFKEDIVYIIYNFLLLEKHGFVKIHRPGIMGL